MDDVTRPTCSIGMYFHCGRCMQERPPDQSPQQWGQIEAGFTALGVQVWCKRHNLNVVHIDFEGQAHPLVIADRAMEQ